MNYSKIKPLDIANAPFISSSIYFSGCNHKCNGCFNKIAWDFNSGEEYNEEIENYFIECLQNPNVKNACILGGEPFQQDLSILYRLVTRIKKETNCDIWIWSGYLYEELLALTNPYVIKILKKCDVLIDGKFDINKRSLLLKFRGSSNQRVIDLKKSLNFKNIHIIK